MGFRLRGGLINAEVGRLQPDLRQVFSSRQIQGACLGGEAGALCKQIGDIVRGKGLVVQGIVEGSGHRLRAVDVTQGDDFSHVGAD